MLFRIFKFFITGIHVRNMIQTFRSENSKSKTRVDVVTKSNLYIPPTAILSARTSFDSEMVGADFVYMNQL